MKNKIVALCVSVLIITALFAKDMPPKREFRGVWLSTVDNIDWPSSRYDSESKKQTDLKNYLLKLKDNGVNSVIFQVRPQCDAMYKSAIEPWSYWFTGEQGKAPGTDWDPLEFAIEEAHKLGMELHAWVNPYRAVKSPSKVNDSNYISSQHVLKQHPDWILKFSDVYILDPGLPEVRNYITNVFMDIVNRYDVDGLHMDDYFYPYSGIVQEDSATFSLDPRGFTDIHDWRRDNINVLVETISDSIDAVKPWVKWGISPFGIWKPGVPSGISGMNAFNVLYCDPIAWLQKKTVDYITPQCYWPFGGGQDYGKLIPWWAEQARTYGRHFYPGQAIYRVRESNWAAEEIPNQVRLNRQTENCDGSVFFTAHSFYYNSKHVADSLKYDLYSSPSLWPVMTWHDSLPPLSPENIQLAVEGDGSKTLSWDAPTYVDPRDSAYAYVVYRSPYPIDKNDMRMAQTVLMRANNEYSDNSSGSYYYGVTSIDRYSNESELFNIDHHFVDLFSPAYASENLEPDTLLKWRTKVGATQYYLEISDNVNFNTPIIQKSVNDTLETVNLGYATKYYWRVKADNEQYWSPVWSFETKLAPQVELLSPLSAYQGVSFEPTLLWKNFNGSTSYEVQISTTSDMSDLLVDASGINDTLYQAPSLEPTTHYYWRVRSDLYTRWSEVASFRTGEIHVETIWENSRLAQNYPDYLSPDLDGAAIAAGNYFGNEIAIVLQSNGDSVVCVAVNAADGQELNFDLNLDGVEGGTHILRDIEFSEDGVIYASNCADKNGEFKIYQWTNPLEAPTLIYQIDNIPYRLGDHISVRGRLDDKSLEIFAAGAKTNKLLKIVWNSSDSKFEEILITLDKNNYKNPSVAFADGADSYYVNSTSYYMCHYSEEGKFIDWMQGNFSMPVRGNSIESFSYNGKQYIATYSSEDESVHIVDASTGLSTAAFVGATYSLGTTHNRNGSGDVEVRARDNGKFDIFVIGNQNGIGVYRFDATSIPTSIYHRVELEDYYLMANYPNPFNPITTIPYSMKSSADVRIEIYDLNGRCITTLYDAYQKSGQHKVVFNAHDLSSGIYICKLIVGNEVSARKLTLLK